MHLVADNTEQAVELTHEDVFHHWQAVVNKPRAKMDVKRRKLISDRLKDGYSYQDMIDAISGCFLSPFHQGENENHQKYDDIGLILRDAERMDKFIGILDDAQAKFERVQANQRVATEKPAPSTQENARAKLEAMKRVLR